MRLSFFTARALATTALLAAGALCQQQNASPSASASASSTSATPTARPSQISSAQPALSTFISTTTLSPGQALPTSLATSASRSGSVYYIPVVTTLPPASAGSAWPPQTSGTAPAAAASASATPSGSQKLPLDTRIDPAFGVLGALLLITGLPMAFYGHRNRWSSYFTAGYYSMSLITICIILKAGVQPAINDPSQTVRGLFLLATIVAGVVGGIFCIVFWRAASLLASGLGGFAFGLFLQALRSGGLIAPLGLRYVLYIPLFAIFFALSCAERIHSLVLAFATAIIGATAVTLAIDCYTRQGLKEFYIRNLGFDWLFEEKYASTFLDGRFPLVQGMQIELGVLGAIVIMGTAFQLRLWSDLRHSMAVLQKSDEERRMRSKAERAARQVSRTAKRDLEEWEKCHGYKNTAGRPTVRDMEKDGRSVLSDTTGLTCDRKGSMMSYLSGGVDAATPMSYNAADRTESPSSASMLMSGNDYPFPTDPSSGHVRRGSSFMSYLQRGPEKPLAPGEAPPQLELAGMDSSTATARSPASPTATALPADDPQRILDEISNIRRSIEMLRASSTGLEPSSPGPTSPTTSAVHFDGRSGWNSTAGQGETRSLDLSRVPTSPTLPAHGQSFRQRTHSTAAILSGSGSFLSKSTAGSPVVSQGPTDAPTESVGALASGPLDMSPSTSNPGDRPGTTGSGSGGAGVGAWGQGVQAPAMSRSTSETPSLLMLADPSFSTATPAHAVAGPSPQAPPVERMPELPNDDAEASHKPERRMSSGSTLDRLNHSYEHGDLSRPRNNSVTQKPRHSLVLAKSMDEAPSAAVVAARRSIATRRNEAPATPWTNPGMEPALGQGSQGPNQKGAAAEKRKSAPRRSMTIEELDARHRAKLAAMQKPVTDSVREAEMLQSVREEYERKQRAEKRRMAEREREREQALTLAALTGPAAGWAGMGARSSRDGATSPSAAEMRSPRRLSAPLLEAVNGDGRHSRSDERTAAWSRSISKVAQVDPSAMARPPLSLASATAAPGSGQVDGKRRWSSQRGSGGGGEAVRSPTRSQHPASPTSPLPVQEAKRRELSETDRRRLSQGAGGGDRRSRRMSQPLLDFQLPPPAGQGA